MCIESKCKVCGCTENSACIGACHWINSSQDLCSGCAPIVDFYPQMHFYQCSSCVVIFGVEAALEDQSSVKCPICQNDEELDDAGFGYVTLTKIPEEEEEEEENIDIQLSTDLGHVPFNGDVRDRECPLCGKVVLSKRFADHVLGEDCKKV
ncbi:hypothetical protein [Paenibacillus agricola]|uniref:Uncharacterized protein n=1 Tax=Paenibacillus agricola TaxID=2716264 RepID=A0ABX0JGF3_9BACL|nr:hypothetical protein [Paenibacillus agricola]NHN33324.1 hypothetical protein [Paenibacillus agricola]